METEHLIKILEYKLKKNFSIKDLKIEDKSFLHEKHKSSSKDKFHIKLTIKSSELKEISSLNANRKIYSVLKKEISANIHSLQIIIV